MTKQNRNKMKQFFVTFPKSKIDKHEFRDVLSPELVNWYMIVEEKHKDGTPHLHALYKLKDGITKSQLLKIYKQKFPDDYMRIDVKPVRSLKHSIAYLSKEDKDPLVSGEFIETRNPSRNHLLKFLREEYGFKDFETFHKHMEEERRKELDFDEFKNEVYKQLLHHKKFDPQGLEYLLIQNNLSRKTSEFFKNFEKSRISKDDITFLHKLLKNKV